MRGIRRWGRAGAQHVIVTCALPLLAQASRRKPHQGMEPVDRARDARDQLNHEIMALDVGQLMQQHVAPPLRTPRVRFSGQQNRGTANAPRHRHRRTLRLQQADVTVESQLQR